MNINQFSEVQEMRHIKIPGFVIVNYKYSTYSGLKYYVCLLPPGHTPNSFEQDSKKAIVTMRMGLSAE